MPTGENYGRTDRGELIGPYDTVEELNRELAASNREALYSEIGELLGQRFTQRELTEITELIGAGSEACDYAAEDLAYRADFDDRHSGGEGAEYQESADAYSERSQRLGELAAAITRGEVSGREDHPIEED